MGILDWLHRLLAGKTPAKRRSRAGAGATKGMDGADTGEAANSADPAEGMDGTDAPEAGNAPDPDPDRIVAMPIEDAIDLHTFAPRDVVSVVDEYLHEARRAGFREVRVIHGRGKGIQRASVRRLLTTHPAVTSFADAPASRGGWGATLVQLKPRYPNRKRPR